MIVTNCTTRAPITLEAVPFAMKLMLHCHYNVYHPLNLDGLHSLLGEFIDASRSGDWNSLVESTIAVDFPDGIRRAKIRTTNSQFPALDRTNSIFTNGYEPQVGTLLDRLIPDDGVFCDIGANWGYFSIYTASRPTFRGEIHAFEPIPDSFADLFGIVKDMGLEPIIHCHNTALSNVDGQTTMTISNNFSGMAKISAEENGLPVTLKRLDDFGFSKVDFMKIDVEGHEGEVILGASALIEAHHPFIVLEDWYDLQSTAERDPNHATALLENMGYQLFAPYWIKSDGSYLSALIGDDSDQQLALIPFIYTVGRSKLVTCLNIIACHHTRVDEMTAALTQ